MNDIINELSKRLKKSTSVLIVDEQDDNFEKLINGHQKVEVARHIMDEEGYLTVKKQYGLILLGEEYLTPRVDLISRIHVLMYRLTASGTIVLANDGNNEVVEKIIKLSKFVSIEQKIETEDKTYYIINRVKNHEDKDDSEQIMKIVTAQVEYGLSDDYDLGIDFEGLLNRLQITKEQFEKYYVDFVDYKFKDILTESTEINEEDMGRTVDPAKFVRLVEQYLGSEYTNEAIEYVNAQFETKIWDKSLLTMQSKLNFAQNVSNTLIDSIEDHDTFKAIIKANKDLDQLDEVYFSFTDDKRSILFPEAKGNLEIELNRDNMNIYSNEQIELMYSSFTNALQKFLDNTHECSVKDFIRLIFDYQKVIRFFKNDVEYSGRFKVDNVFENIKQLLILILEANAVVAEYQFTNEYINTILETITTKFVGYQKLADDIEDFEDAVEVLDQLPKIVDIKTYFKGKLKLSTKVLNISATKLSSKVKGKNLEQQIVTEENESLQTVIKNTGTFDYVYADTNYIYPSIDIRRTCYYMNDSIKLNGEIIFKVLKHDLNELKTINSIFSIIGYSLVQLLQDINGDYYIVLKNEGIQSDLESIDLGAAYFLQQSYAENSEIIKTLKTKSELYDFYIEDEKMCVLLTDFQSYYQYIAQMILLTNRAKKESKDFFYPLEMVKELSLVVDKDNLDLALGYMAYYENFLFEYPIVFDDSLRKTHTDQTEAFKLMLDGKITNQREYIQNVLANTTIENDNSEFISFTQFESQVAELLGDSTINIKRKIGSNQNGYLKQVKIQKSLRLNDEQFNEFLNQFKRLFTTSLMTHRAVEFVQNYDHFTKVIYEYRSLFKILYNLESSNKLFIETNKNLTEEELMSAHIEDIILTYLLAINDGEQILNEIGDLGERIYHALNNAKSSRYIKNQFLDIKEMIETNIIMSLGEHLHE